MKVKHPPRRDWQHAQPVPMQRPAAEPVTAQIDTGQRFQAWLQPTRGAAWVRAAGIRDPWREWCAGLLANYVNGLPERPYDTAVLPAGVRPVDVQLPEFRGQSSGGAFGLVRLATAAERERVAPPYRFPRPRSVYSDVEGAEVS